MKFVQTAFAPLPLGLEGRRPLQLFSASCGVNFELSTQDVWVCSSQTAADRIRVVEL